MNFGEQLKRIRRLLRDPDGNLWTRSLLLNLYNDVQKEIQIKTKLLSDVQVLGIPPFYQCSYLSDWEWPYLPSGQDKFYKALRDQGDYVFCHRFEPQVVYGQSSDASDEGSHFTQPWEAFAGLVPGETVKIKYPSNFHTAQYLAYDKKPLEYRTKKEITNVTPSYISLTGLPQWYYREDEIDNTFTIFPAPSTIVWNDVTTSSASPEYVFTQNWEDTDYLDGEGEEWTRTDSTNERDYVYPWELDIGASSDYGYRGMFLFELNYLPVGQEGLLWYIVDETADVFGTVVDVVGSLLNNDLGIAVSYLEDTNNVLLIYDISPIELVADSDESDFPRFMQKYIEYGVVSRAYGANTDGRIQSLSDYWNVRFQTGIELLKKYKSMKLHDRDFRLVTPSVPARRTHRHPRLPDAYPAI